MDDETDLLLARGTKALKRGRESEQRERRERDKVQKREKMSALRAASLEEYKKVLEKYKQLVPESQDALTDYFLLGKIGEGAFGEVFEARHKQTGVTVALKIIKMHRTFQADNGISLDLVREINILTALSDSPFFVQLIETFFTHDGDMVMSFEYCKADLSGLLAQPDIELREEHCKCLLEQVLRGLVILHDRGYMHRDCKASNLLLSSTGQVKIADFGLATNYKQRERFGCNVVTLWYRAPELLLGDEYYGPAVDIWATGCIMYELFARTPLVRGREEASQFDLIMQLIGTPTTDSWPEAQKLPHFETLVTKKYEQPLPSTLNTVLGAFLQSQDALDLCKKLLEPSPSKRLTAKGALEHPFFSRGPTCTRSDLPSFLPMHEFEVRRRRAAERASQKMQKASSSQNIASESTSVSGNVEKLAVVEKTVEKPVVEKPVGKESK